MRNKKNIFLLVCIVILSIVNISIYMTKIAIPTSTNNKIKKQYEAEMNAMWKEPTEKEKLEELQKMSEGQRIANYISQYFTFLEKKEYASAYKLLHPDFKNNYFKTEEAFEAYCKKTYPEMITTDIVGAIREGKYYIITIRILDFLKPNDPAKTVKHILVEEDFNKFQLSFQVI